MPAAEFVEMTWNGEGGVLYGSDGNMPVDGGGEAVTEVSVSPSTLTLPAGEDAVQQMRVEYRWQAIEQESKEMELGKELGKDFIANKLENGDSPKQLLARSRYLLSKRKDKWTASQTHRSEILFRLYPSLEQAYELSQ